MSESIECSIGGELLLLTMAGAVYWPAREALIVADLHFEKGAAFAARGVMLPPYDTRTTLKRLAVLQKRFSPKQIFSLGDAFHRQGADEGMDDDDAARLDALMLASRWVWVLGNHDPAPPARFSAATCAEMRLGSLTLRHEPAAGASPGELAGHLHPCARIRTEGGPQRRRCFASDGARLILPAFGAYTGGLNVLDQAYAGMFAEDFAVYAMGARGVYPIARQRLAPDERTQSQRIAS